MHAKCQAQFLPLNKYQSSSFYTEILQFTRCFCIHETLPKTFWMRYLPQSSDLPPEQPIRKAAGLRVRLRSSDTRASPFAPELQALLTVWSRIKDCDGLDRRTNNGMEVKEWWVRSWVAELRGLLYMLICKTQSTNTLSISSTYIFAF